MVVINYCIGHNPSAAPTGLRHRFLAMCFNSFHDFSGRLRFSFTARRHLVLRRASISSDDLSSIHYFRMTQKVLQSSVQGDRKLVNTLLIELSRSSSMRSISVIAEFLQNYLISLSSSSGWSANLNMWSYLIN